MNPNRDLRTTCIIALALVALTLKLAIAYNTIGTNDVVFFYGFAKVLSEHGLEWTYQHSRYFNHPPLTAYYLRGIFALTEQPWCQDLGIHFPFLLRLPGIIADFLVVLVLLRMTKTDLRIPTWALALFALSPVSLMVSGFHGNTDPVMVMFLVLASFFCLREKSVWCGLFLALSCQIKIIPLLLLPIFFFFWLARRRAVSFSLPFVLVSLVLWAEPLLKFPALFVKNVLSYGSFWGIWGITYWLRLTNLAMFRMVTFYHFPPMQSFVATLLKLIIIAAVLMIAWRRRNLGERALLDSLAYAWIVFFVFAPGVCAQYMVWLAPFVLVLSPVFYGWLAASSSLFLFFFYNVAAGEFPWYGALSTSNLYTVWTPWSLWPWAVLIAGLIIFWKNARRRYPSLRLLSLDALP